VVIGDRVQEKLNFTQTGSYINIDFPGSSPSFLDAPLAKGVPRVTLTPCSGASASGWKGCLFGGCSSEEEVFPMSRQRLSDLQGGLA